MADIPTCIWHGKSGAKYSYYILPLPAQFNPNQPGNYIYAYVNSENKWAPIFIGEGELSERVGPLHPQAICIAAKGATHIHVHANASEQHRLAEVKDLLGMYSLTAYAPAGCNEKTSV